MSIRLKPEIAEHIKKTPALRLKVQATINASHNTIVKYLDANDGSLTRIDVLNVITEEMQVPLSSIINGSFSKLMTE
jgi:hypothetical protein